MKRYYSHVLDLPKDAPYDKDETRFFSWLGNFVRPLRETGLFDRYWFTYYGDHVRYRVYTDRYDDLKPHVEALILSCGLTLRDEEKDLDLVGDLGHARFLSTARGDKNAESRALLALSFLHAAAELVLDNLVDLGDGYWALERSQHGENPNQSNFESLHHLFCNVTQVPLSVLFTAEGGLQGTWWGPRGGQRPRMTSKGQVIEVFIPY